MMMLLNYNHAADLHGSWGSEVYVEPNGVTHHAFGTLTVMAQTYIARYQETDDESFAIPFITSFNTTTQGHVDVSASKFLGLFLNNCTQVTYWLDVSNCDCFSACMTNSV